MGSNIDHDLELCLHFGGEVGFDFIDIAEFGEGPAAVGGEVVHAGNPVGLHGGGLFLGVLAAVAFDFYNKVEQVFCAMAIIHADDEVRAVAVRDFQAEVVILDIGADLRIAFIDAAELRFPIAVEDDPAEQRFGGGPLVSQRLV